MTTSCTAPTATTTYEVAWGIEAHQSTAYVDHGDGSFLSIDAEARATRAWLALIRQGVRAGFYINGEHRHGYDFAEEWAAAEAADAPTPVEHKTRTFLDDHGGHLNWRKVHRVGSPLAWAACSCGWKVLRDNRDLARRAAREHRASATRSA